MIEIDPTSPVPLYRQIADEVRRLVALGALREGDRIPTVRELAVRTRVNRNTAARAIQHLESAGVVRTRVGQGTFVVEPGGTPADRSRNSDRIDRRIDRLLVEAQTAGLPLDDLRRRLAERIDRFRERQAAEALRLERPGEEEEEDSHA